ncbi:hypothetical protein COCON_G00208350 [Conger conger]|uniref:Guanine nucleotide-binding protein subunit gamma n=1 Tax=Conger conger TaxID=82655 RepID=A0A9Q1D0L9_CONCO|nr:hypothetical protein COCON_G00208350 [Conger conger]
MSNNSAINSNLVIAQKAVKQLRLEASVRRIKVSQAAADLKTYLIIPSGRQNPAPSSDMQVKLVEPWETQGSKPFPFLSQLLFCPCGPVALLPFKVFP